MKDFILEPGYVDVTSMLPSKGKFYPSGIAARPYSFAEISSVNERLSLEVEDEVGAYNHILNGITFMDTETSIKDMFVGDFLFVAFYRKVITTGTRQFTLSSVIEGWESDPIQVSDINFRDITAPALPACARILDEIVEFRPLTVGQWLKFLTDYGKHMNVNDMLKMMSNGKVDPVNVFNPAETEVLTQVIAALDHGIDPVEVKVKRKGGDESKTVEVNLETSLSTIVLPFRNDEDAGSSGIWFGNESGTES